MKLNLIITHLRGTTCIGITALDVIGGDRPLIGEAGGGDAGSSNGPLPSDFSSSLAAPTSARA